MIIERNEREGCVFAARYPNRVSAVAAYSPAISLGQRPASPPQATARTAAPSVAGDPLEGVYPSVLRTNAMRFERFREIQAAADPAAIVATARAIASVDYATVLPRIEAPTLMVATALYRGRSVEMVRLVSALIPNATFEIMQTGHFAAFESPQLVTTSVDRFLSQNGW